MILSKLTPWMMAIRPKTLTAAVVPVCVGTMLARADRGTVNLLLFLCALLFACFIQIGTNLINDALDFKKGSDTSQRLGPVRVTQAGLLTIEQVFAWGIACLMIAMILGIPLIIQGGWILAVILSLSAVSAYLYTGGPMPLAYCGLGDLFVLIFFGFVATVSVYFLQTGFLDRGSFLAAAQIGSLAVVMLAVNNLRDIKEDTRANKRTLPVRFGKQFARIEITLLILLPFFLSFLWFAQGYAGAAYLPWIVLPAATFIIKGVWSTEPGKIYNHFLGYAALLHLFFGLLLSLGFWLE